MLTTDDKTLILFLAHEVKRQGKGPIDVANYVWAWETMRSTLTRGRERRMTTPITETWMHNLAVMTEPTNFGKYRQVPATFASGKHALDWALIPRAMKGLLDAQENLNPEQFYYEFERIHPYTDGNGRVGLMLMNYLNNTMDKPILPPEIEW